MWVRLHAKIVDPDGGIAGLAEVCLRGVEELGDILRVQVGSEGISQRQENGKRRQKSQSDSTAFPPQSELSRERFGTFPGELTPKKRGSVDDLDEVAPL
jgi:hypothetical protein